MTYAADVPRTRRAATLSTVIGVHLAAIALIALAKQAPAIRVVPQSISVLSLASADAQATPPPVLPSKRPPEKRVATALSLSTTPKALATEASTAGCAALDDVSQAIIADPDAVAALQQAPVETRSVADAIVIWNGGWSAPTAADDAPLRPVRKTVIQSLTGLDEDCLGQSIVGPRFIPVPEGDRTLLLVFGSGTWTWKQLVDSENSIPATSTQPMFTQYFGH